MHSLPIFVRLNGRAVILIGGGEAAAAKRVLLERAGARIVAEEESAALAIVALVDGVEAREVALGLKARGILVNVVDCAALCDFTLPAIVDRNPVLIAIGTGGASAGLAKALRQRLETILPQSLGKIAMALEAARGAIRTRWPEAAPRRRAIDGALNPGGLLDVLAEHRADAVTHWLTKDDDAAGVTSLHHLHLISDDPDDLTLRQARLLGQADVIFHTATVSAQVLARGRADALRTLSIAPPTIVNNGLTLYLERK